MWHVCALIAQLHFKIANFRAIQKSTVSCDIPIRCVRRMGIFIGLRISNRLDILSVAAYTLHGPVWPVLYARMLFASNSSVE